jgi:hypothetical protein
MPSPIFTVRVRGDGGGGQTYGLEDLAGIHHRELVASFPEHRDGAPWPKEKVTASSQRAARRKRERTLRQRVAQAGAERRVFCSVHCGLPILTVLVFLTKFQ